MRYLVFMDRAAHIAGYAWIAGTSWQVVGGHFLSLSDAEPHRSLAPGTMSVTPRGLVQAFSPTTYWVRLLK